MNEFHTIQVRGSSVETLRNLLKEVPMPFAAGDRVGIKIHWGEAGNKNFLHPRYTREIVRWLQESDVGPFVFDTTVLYSGGRREGAKSIKTAAGHGFTEQYLGCPVIIGDGMDGRDIVEIPSVGRHFPSIETAAVIRRADGFVIFSHFKGHMASGFGGAIKNISMGMASRAQKQRMHADAHPVLNQKRCTRCGLCAKVCPAGSVSLPADGYPVYRLDACIGCSQCIAYCPEAALKIFWNAETGVFQERLVETAASIWKIIGMKTVNINALIQIVKECDCLPGKHPVIASDVGFIASSHPVNADESSVHIVGADVFDRAHPNVPWRRQFSYAREIGFVEKQ